jgi:DNA-binding MarR family transcriptional regulator
MSTRDSALPALQRRNFELGKYLPFRLTVLSNRLTRQVSRFYSDRFQLSAPEWRTMAVLGQNGPMTANLVIQQTTMDKVRVSRAVAKLLKTGYITRDSDPADRRRAVLALTPAGLDVYREIVPLVQEVEANVMSDLTRDERVQLEAALAKLEAFLERSGDAAADGETEE